MAGWPLVSLHYIRDVPPRLTLARQISEPLSALSGARVATLQHTVEKMANPSWNELFRYKIWQLVAKTKAGLLWESISRNTVDWLPRNDASCLELARSKDQAEGEGFELEEFAASEPRAEILSVAKDLLRHGLSGQSGGGRGIRTPGTLSGTSVFKTDCFNRSHIPPRLRRVYQVAVRSGVRESPAPTAK